jgi:hypothetical protein
MMTCVELFTLFLQQTGLEWLSAVCLPLCFSQVCIIIEEFFFNFLFWLMLILINFNFKGARGITMSNVKICDLQHINVINTTKGKRLHIGVCIPIFFI